MATKTLFITLSRESIDEPWGFTLAEEDVHRRLDCPLVVQNIVSSSPAYKAGLYPGDIVLGIDNSPITGRPLTYLLAVELVKRARESIELQVLREPANRVKKKTMYTTQKSPESYRPASVNRGIIPSIATMDSGVRLPDNNIEEFFKDKAREQWAITKQTYRTTPLIEPKPKVRRDWPTGSYIRHMEGPGWHTLPSGTIHVQDANKLKVLNNLNQPISQQGPGMVHLQYNSPINLYSTENLNNSILPQRGVSPGRFSQHSPAYSHQQSASPQPTFNARANHPISVDITQSPTYQFLHEEEKQSSIRHGYSPRYSPVTGQHSPSVPVQTPYFKTLMHTLNVSDH